MVTALLIAAVLWVGIGVGVGVAIAWSARHDQVWEVERPVWADDPTPIYDAIVCESIEKAEGWS